MGSQRVEFESEAWYRAIAEGRLAPVSDGIRGQTWLPAGRQEIAGAGRRPPRGDRPLSATAVGLEETG